MKFDFLKRLLKNKSGDADVGAVLGAIAVIFVVIVGAYLVINVYNILF